MKGLLRPGCLALVVAFVVAGSALAGDPEIEVRLFLFEQPTNENNPQANPLGLGATPVDDLSQITAGTPIYLEVWAITNTCNFGLSTVAVDIAYNDAFLSTSEALITLNPNWNTFRFCPNGTEDCTPSPGQLNDVGASLNLDVPAIVGLFSRVATIRFNVNVTAGPDDCLSFIASQNRTDRLVCRGKAVDGPNGQFTSWAVPDGTADLDGDGILNCTDNCPNTANGEILGRCLAGNVGLACTSDVSCGSGGDCSLDQEDLDEDGVGDVCDNCPTVANPGQEDDNLNGFGDLCEPVACCLPGDVCSDLDLTGCALRGGTNVGLNTQCATVDCTSVPTVSQWGLIILTMGLLTCGSLVFSSRRVPRMAT